MIKEEAKQWIENLILTMKEETSGLFPDVPYKDEVYEALDEAVKALSQDSCEDAISRQAAIEVAKQYWYKPDIAGALEELPSVQQEPKIGHWIPVSERLPKPYTYVNATCRSLADDRENWVVETMYLPIPKENDEQGYSDWGNIPMLNWGKAEVIAWMERKIPEPYRAEMEGGVCKGCHYNDGEVHAECVVCDKAEMEGEE